MCPSNKYNWIEELKNNIGYIKSNKKVKNIFMCKSNEYDKCINLLSNNYLI